MAGNFGSKAILRKYDGRGRAAGEDALVGVAAPLSVAAGILGGSIKGSVGTLRPMVGCGPGEAQGKKQHMALRLVPWEAVSPSLSDCFIMYEAAMTSISRRHFNNNKPMSRSAYFDANNKQNL